MDPRIGILRISLGAALCTWVAACSSAGGEYRTQMLASAIQQQQTEHFTRTFAIEAPERALALARQRAHAPGVGDLIAAGAWPEDFSEWERAAIELFYTVRQNQGAFVVAGQLTADGQAIVGLVEGAPRHAIDPQALGLGQITERQEALAALGTLEPAFEHLLLSTDDEATLAVWMHQHAALDATLPSSDAVFDAISAPGPDNPLPSFSEAIDQIAAALSQAAVAEPELELLLARAMVRYARIQQFDNLNLIPTAMAEDRGWDVEDSDQHEAISVTLLHEALRTLTDPGSVAAWLPSLEPPTDQYRRLQRGYDEYERYVVAGGWSEIPFTSELRIGASGPAVAALRRRLAAENYLAVDSGSDAFDAELRDAVRAYQRTHQLTDSGALSEETATSLSVPAERRLAQIEATIDRWRSARSTRDAGGEFIFVSVPDFHGELWDQGELVYRWRVVTGRPMNVRGPDGEMVVQGRTPMFSDTMLYVVFNPYWNVPPDIRRFEYQPEIDADPTWLATHHFEIVSNPDGSDWLRQLPGDHNLLGRVKFLFPNEHDVYMHDTPAKSLFDRPVRAYSHGCVRVHEPMTLANVILRRDRGWTEAQTQRFIDEKLEIIEEQWVTLQRPIAVHIEYFTVRGDDDGRMNFLADIYRYDRARVDEREAAIRARYGLEPAGGTAEASPEPAAAPAAEGGPF